MTLQFLQLQSSSHTRCILTPSHGLSDVETTAKIIPLSSQDYTSTIKNMADLGLSGGIIYAALIVRAAKKSGADKVLTFNIDDFSSLWPEGESHFVVP